MLRVSLVRELSLLLSFLLWYKEFEWFEWFEWFDEFE